MAWFKVDDNFEGSPKILGVSAAALGLWTLAGAWSARFLTDGEVPESWVRIKCAQYAGQLDAAADELVTAGMWERTANGYRFHDWHDYQPSSDEVAERRAKRVAAGRKGGMARAAKQTASSSQASAKQVLDEPLPSASSTPQAKSNPVPVPVPVTSNEVTHTGNEVAGPTRPAGRATYPPAFEAFWDAYPKHKDKKAALKAWKQATKEVPNETLIEAATAYAADKTRDPQYTKHPATWLNAGAWDDQPDQPAPHTISMWDYLPEAGGDAA